MMKHIQNHKMLIRTALVSSCMIGFNILFIVLCYENYIRLCDARISLAVSNGQRALSVVSDHIARLLDDSDSYVRSVRNYYVEHGDANALSRYLQEIKINSSADFHAELNIINSNGTIKFNSIDRDTKNFTLKDVRYFDYFKNNPQDSVYIDPSRRGKLTGTLQFRLVRPILKNGVFNGCIVQALRPEYFTALFTAFDLGPHSFTAMFTVDHRLIARQPSAPEENYGVFLDNIDLWSHLTHADSGQYVTRSPIDGIDRHILFVRVPGYPIVVDIGVSRQDIIDGLSDARLYIMLQAISVLLLSAMFCVFTFIILRKNNQLTIAEQAIRAAVNTDFLTGAKSRKYFLENAELEFTRAVRYDLPLAVMMIDADHFKSVNDNYGHAAGDAALRRLAESITEVLRENDSLGRIGGEEFAILMPQTPINGAEALAERVRARIAGIEIPVADSLLRLTVSIGVGGRFNQTSSFSSMLQEADRALYRAKEAGRDRVVLAESPH